MNFNHNPRKVAVVGMSGTGKTTKLIQLLTSLSKGYKWTFVFDPELEVSRKLGWQAAYTGQGMKWLFDSGGPIIFYPGKMFPDDDSGQGFSFFCTAVLQLCQSVNGPKLVLMDEVQEATELHATGIPKSFRKILNLGRREEIDLLIGGQSINDVHTRIRRQLTELFVFKQVETDSEAFKRLQELGIPKAEVLKLPHASQGQIGFIYRHLLTGKTQKFLYSINAPHGQRTRNSEPSQQR